MIFDKWDCVARKYLAEIEGFDETCCISDRVGSIAFLSDTFEDESGIGTVSFELAKNFSKYVDTTVYVLEGRISEEKENQLLEEDVEVRKVSRKPGLKGKMASLKEIADKVSSEDYGHIHSHGMFMPLVAWMTDSEYSVGYHGHITKFSEVTKHPVKWFQWYFQLFPALRKANTVFCISKYTKKQLKLFYGVKGKRIYNGINKERFKEEKENLRESYGIDPSIKVYGTLSSLKAYKNVEEVLERFKDRSDSDSLLIIGGDGEYRSRLENYAESLGISDRTIFTGFVPEDQKAAFYNTIDEFLYYSEWEGFGLTPVEAYSSGCDVDTASNTGLKELKFGGGESSA